MNLSYETYKRQTIFWCVVILIVISGIYSFFKISKLEDPEIVVMQAMVVTVYPGASAHEVELQVTNVIENELRSMDGIAEIQSTSMANISKVSVMLKFTVPEKEITQHWDVMRRKIAAAKSKLPTNAMEPMVMDDIGDVYGMFYAMTGEGFSYEELNKYANFIKRELLILDGVKRVEIFGNQPPCIDIEISKEKIAQLGIYPAQIVLSVNNQASPVYAGNYEQDDEVLRLGINGKIKTEDDIKNIIIKGFEGDQFRLGDIAKIERTVAEPARYQFLYNGENALAISVSMESGNNIIDVGKEVEERLEEMSSQIPAGIQLNKVFFQPEKVQTAINDFMLNLVVSVVIVILVLMFTMGFKSGVIIGSGLVLTVLTTFPVLLALDGTLQRISLGAFIVAMGMLVDNAIVVMDGIIVDLQFGKPVKTALFSTAKKTAMALLGATSIAIVAFLPVYLSPDTAGIYIGDLFIVLCISLGISWIFALTQVPIFSARMLNFKSYRGKKQKPFDSRIYQWQRKLLHIVLNKKVTTLLVVFALLAVSLYGFKFVKRTFFPDFTYDQAFVEYTRPLNTSPTQVIADLKTISNDLLKIEGVKNVTASHGMTPSRYCLVRAYNVVGDNYGEFIIDFDDYATMKKLRPQIERYFRENHPDAYTRFRLYNISILSSHTVEVEFTGPDPQVLRDLEQQAEKIMKQSPKINPYTVQPNVEPISKYLAIDYLQTTAQQINTTRNDVSNTLLAATDKLPFATLWDGNVATPVNLKIRNSDGSKIKDLKNIPVWNIIPNLNALSELNISNLLVNSNSMSELQKKIVTPVPLSQVTNGIDLSWENGVIQRKNGQRSIQAQCEPAPDVSPEEARLSIKDAIEEIELPIGYKMEWMGEYDMQQRALINVFNLLPLAGVLIIFILVMLFNDYKKPLIILLCLPIVFIGIVPVLILSKQPFSFTAIVGTIGMAGMLIKNSIVLLEEIEHLINSKIDPYTAVIEATISRTRPVMMASITTILGVIPLITDPMYGPLAVTIMSGLLVGTLITLVLVPIFYARFYNIKKQVTKL